MSESRQQPEQALRQHVAAVRRVHFAVDGERARASERLDAHRAGSPFFVVVETSRAKHDFEILLFETSRVLVEAAGDAVPCSIRESQTCLRIAHAATAAAIAMAVLRRAVARNVRCTTDTIAHRLQSRRGSYAGTSTRGQIAAPERSRRPARRRTAPTRVGCIDA